jgi:hypothetical protein
MKKKILANCKECIHRKIKYIDYYADPPTFRSFCGYPENVIREKQWNGESMSYRRSPRIINKKADCQWYKRPHIVERVFISLLETGGMG